MLLLNKNFTQNRKKCAKQFVTLKGNFSKLVAFFKTFSFSVFASLNSNCFVVEKLKQMLALRYKSTPFLPLRLGVVLHFPQYFSLLDSKIRPYQPLKFVWNKNTLLLTSFSCYFVVYHKILLTFFSNKNHLSSFHCYL